MTQMQVNTSRAPFASRPYVLSLSRVPSLFFLPFFLPFVDSDDMDPFMTPNGNRCPLCGQQLVVETAVGGKMPGSRFIKVRSRARYSPNAKTTHIPSVAAHRISNNVISIALVWRPLPARKPFPPHRLSQRSLLLSLLPPPRPRMCWHHQKPRNNVSLLLSRRVGQLGSTLLVLAACAVNTVTRLATAPCKPSSID